MAEHAGAAGGPVSEGEEAGTLSPTSASPTDEDSSAAPGPGEPSAELPRTDAQDDGTADTAGAVDCGTTVEYDDDVDAADAKQPRSHVRLATAVGSATVVALFALVGWVGFQAYESHQSSDRRGLLLQVGRQAALNLTTIDWQHADADVQRIQDSATGAFYDEFSKNSRPFIDVVKEAQTTSVGTTTEAGLESEAGDQAQVLVTVSVKTTSNLGAAEQEPRFWRMRITVDKVNDGAKVSNVAFVP